MKDMPLKALTLDNAFCSSCGSQVDPFSDVCKGCGQPFEGKFDAFLCPACGTILPLKASKCDKCGLKFKILAPLRKGEDDFLSTLLEWKKSKSGMEVKAEAKEESFKRVGSSLQGEGEVELWKLSEPLERVIRSRRKRLEQVDWLLSQAKRRIKELEESKNPLEIREREELERQVQEILAERENIVKIEEGIAEMERIYRNILAVQEAELKEKRKGLRVRLDAFKSDMEKREAEKNAIRMREEELNRREEELRTRIERIEERERQLCEKEEELRETIKIIEERRERDASSKIGGIPKEKWLEAQRQIQKELLKLRGGEFKVETTNQTVRDLNLRISELEEEIEKILEEKAGLEREREELKKLDEETRKVLKIMDDLLEKLPDKEIRKFAESEDFKLYEKVLSKYNL